MKTVIDKKVPVYRAIFDVEDLWLLLPNYLQWEVLLMIQ